MAEPIYVNRTRLVSSLDNSLVQPFNDLSKQTRIPKSRLLDEAVEDLLKKYEEKQGRG
ncbi:ribbon-helix-helix domain-containing protein [Pseudoflavonifractor sp. An184]|uniref:ribbon-helix-helix domain-containing protein n=1 Tax=Pseudoflavonifractor sp. An184 TaxID=1965576 RepID=UPI000B38FD91|nr:ribbon-helix-helix domain-containing protein [Pseudoflavonifractor sp. An184]OUP47273.1 ribbon-helix-helix domain-containing protein [Pseudoflavonifractor sp. An184]